MQKKSAYKKCYGLACYYLAKRAHSIEELKKKLKEKDHPAEEIDKVISNLIEYNLLDDAEFAFSRVRYRYQTCRWGEIRIKRELQEKGVDKEIIEDSLKKRYEDGTLKEEEIINQAFELIYSRYKNKVELQNNRLTSKSYSKVIGFLSRRGYTFSQIKQALDLFLENL